jgi:hypothetical protein
LAFTCASVVAFAVALAVALTCASANVTPVPLSVTVALALAVAIVPSAHFAEALALTVIVAVAVKTIGVGVGVVTDGEVGNPHVSHCLSQPARATTLKRTTRASESVLFILTSSFLTSHPFKDEVFCFRVFCCRKTYFKLPKKMREIY